jgi:hypothetical protein
MRKETNHESSFAQSYGATDEHPPSPMATAWQANKHEIWEVLKNAAPSAVFSRYQRRRLRPLR